MHSPQTSTASLPSILLYGIVVSAQIGRSVSGPVPSDTPSHSPENPADLPPSTLRIAHRLEFNAARRQDANSTPTTEPSLSSSIFPSSTSPSFTIASATSFPSPTDTVGEVRHVSSPVAMIAGSLAGFIVILAAVLVAVVARRHRHNDIRNRGGRASGSGRRPSRRGTRRSARGGYRGNGDHDDPRTPQQLLSGASIQRKKQTHGYASYKLSEDPPDVDGDDAYDIELHERGERASQHPHPHLRPHVTGDRKNSSSSSPPSPRDSRPSPELFSPPRPPSEPLPLQSPLPPPSSGVGAGNSLLLDDLEDLPPAYPGVR